jgi:hypothetical protein
VRAVSGVLLLAAVAAACASEPAESTGTSREAVIDGTPDTKHVAVVSIETTPDASTTGELCSGTLIAPRVVLTAGHCTFGQDAGSLVVGIGPNVEYPSSTPAIAAVVTYPGFSGTTEDMAAGLDLGAILLAEDAEEADGGAIVPVPLGAPGTGTVAGSTLTVVGYGYSDAADADTRGIRREGQVGVSASCSALVAFGDATSNACHGDSGGALLVRAADGSESLVGVVSYGDPLHCVTPSYAVRTDRYAAWIDALIAGPDDAGSCSGCPPRATDCQAIEQDGGDDAGEEAGAGLPEGGREVGAPGVTPAKSSGGCTCAGGAGGSMRGVGLLAGLVLGLGMRWRRRTRQAGGRGRG